MKLLGVNKYIHIFKLSLMEQLAYRAAFFLNYLSTVFTFAIYLVLWPILFSTQSVIQGYTLPLILATLLTTVTVRQLVNNSGTTDEIEEHFQKGTILIHLPRPINFFWLNFFSLLGGVFLRTLFILPVSILIQYYFLGTFPTFLSTFEFILLILIGSFVFYEIYFMIGVLSIWIGETWGVQNVFGYSSWLFSGAMVPVDFFPPFLRSISAVLPFEHGIFVPVKLFLNQPGVNFLNSLIVLVLWAVALFMMKSLLWTAGLKVHDGKG